MHEGRHRVRTVTTSLDHFARLLYAITGDNPQPWIYLNEEQRERYRKFAEQEAEKALLEEAAQEPTDHRPDREFLVIRRSRSGMDSVFESRKRAVAKSAHLLLEKLYKEEVDRNDGIVSIHVELIGEKA